MFNKCVFLILIQIKMFNKYSKKLLYNPYLIRAYLRKARTWISVRQYYLTFLVGVLSLNECQQQFPFKILLFLIFSKFLKKYFWIFFLMKIFLIIFFFNFNDKFFRRDFFH